VKQLYHCNCTTGVSSIFVAKGHTHYLGWFAGRMWTNNGKVMYLTASIIAYFYGIYKIYQCDCELRVGDPCCTMSVLLSCFLATYITWKCVKIHSQVQRHYAFSSMEDGNKYIE